MSEDLNKMDNITTDESQAGVASILQRAFIFLEDGEWDKAQEYFERVLDCEPTNAQAYLGELMVDCKVKAKEELINCANPFDDNKNYEKVCRYGDQPTITLLQEYNESIKERNAERELEEKYNSAVTLFDEGKNNGKVSSMEQAFSIFESISEYKDSSKRIEELTTEISTAKDKATAKAKRIRKITVISVASIVVVVIIAFLLVKVIMPSVKYNQAQQYVENGDFEAAIVTYKELEDYKDSEAMVLKTRYLQACSLLSEGKYEAASLVFDEIIDYEDSSDKKKESEYLRAKELIEKGELESACDILVKLRDYSDTKEILSECWLKLAQQEYDSKNYKDGIDWYKKIPSYSIKTDLFKNLVLSYAKELMEDNLYNRAINQLKQLDNKEANELIKKAKYGYVKLNKNNDDTTTFEYLKDLKKVDYKDCAKIYKELYSWKVEVEAVNTNSDDTVTNLSAVSKYGPIFIHYIVKGGTPDESIVLTTDVTMPDGFSMPRRAKQEMYDGQTGTLGWSDTIFDQPHLTPTGYIYVDFYDDDHNKLGSHSFLLSD